MKLDAVKTHGAKCKICGYDDLGDLSFHHLRDKKFEISRSKNMPHDEIMKELEKCVLVCSRCHGEIHAGVTLCA